MSYSERRDVDHTKTHGTLEDLQVWVRLQLEKGATDDYCDSNSEYPWMRSCRILSEKEVKQEEIAKLEAKLVKAKERLADVQ